MSGAGLGRDTSEEETWTANRPPSAETPTVAVRPDRRRRTGPLDVREERHGVGERCQAVGEDRVEVAVGGRQDLTGRPTRHGGVVLGDLCVGAPHPVPQRLSGQTESGEGAPPGPSRHGFGVDENPIAVEDHGASVETVQRDHA